MEQRAHLYTLAGVCALPRALSPHREVSPRSDIGGFAADRGSYTSPATACAVYPFVYLRKANTLRCKLFTFHKSCNRSKAYSIRERMKNAEQRMKELQKLIEYGRNYQTYKPIQDEYRQIRWKGKQEKFAEARRTELTLWNAANRYLHAHLPEGVKTLPISAWEKEYTALKAQREAEYDTLKKTRAEVAELQKIRRCVDIALHADQPEQTQSRTKRHEQER